MYQAGLETGHALGLMERMFDSLSEKIDFAMRILDPNGELKKKNNDKPSTGPPKIP